MRTALCFYGQPREINNTWPLIKNFVVDPNNADVFFHAWYDSENLSMNKLTPGHEDRRFIPGLDKRLEAALLPKKSLIQKQVQFYHKNFAASEKNIDLCWPWSRIYDRESFVQDRSKVQFSMWYSILSSLMLKDLHSHENGFTYDCVVLSRFDVMPHVNFDPHKYDLNCLNFQDLNKERGEITDWFMFSSDKIMNVVASLYFALDFHYEKIKSGDDVWTSEAFLRDHMKMYGIKSLPVDLKVSF